MEALKLQLEERLARLEVLLTQTYLCQKRALTLQEAATFSGRSTSNLYKLTSAGEIPHSKPKGKIIYIDRLELEQWMLHNPIKPRALIEQEAATHVTLSTLKKRGGGRW